tara:strand:+ start:62 stop:631 length:570 start_codon:yes stop_codon:yes gene_type:complete
MVKNNIIYCFISIFSLLLSNHLKASDIDLSSHLIYNVPVKRSSDEPGKAIGARIQTSYNFQNNLAIYSNITFLYGFSKDLFGLKTQTNIYYWGLGGKVFLSKPQNKILKSFYFDAEIIIDWITSKASGLDSVDNKTVDHFVYGASFGFGYQYDKLDFSIKPYLYDLTINQPLNYSGLALSVGYHLEGIL